MTYSITVKAETIEWNTECTLQKFQSEAEKKGVTDLRIFNSRRNDTDKIIHLTINGFTVTGIATPK